MNSLISQSSPDTILILERDLYSSPVDLPYLGRIIRTNILLQINPNNATYKKYAKDRLDIFAGVKKCYGFGIEQDLPGALNIFEKIKSNWLAAPDLKQIAILLSSITRFKIYQNLITQNNDLENQLCAAANDNENIKIQGKLIKNQQEKSAIITTVVDNYKILITLLGNEKLANFHLPFFSFIFKFSNGTKLFSDKIKILNTYLEFLGVLNTELANTQDLIITDDMLAFFKSMLDTIMEKSNFITSAADWGCLVNQLLNFTKVAQHKVIKEFFLKYLLKLANLAKDNNKFEIELAINDKLVEFYHENPDANIYSPASLIDIETLLDRTVALATNINKNMDKSKLAEVYLRISSKLPTLPATKSALSKSSNLGNKKAMLQSCDNWSFTIDPNIDYLNFKLAYETAIYPEDLDMLKQLMDSLEKYLKHHSYLLTSNLYDKCKLAYQNACLNDNPLELINKNYFPALIKLTFNSFKDTDELKSLYLAARLLAYITLFQHNIYQDYGFSPENLNKIKERATAFIGSKADNKNNKRHLAEWYFNFLNRIENFKRTTMPLFLATHSETKINIDALILGDAEKFLDYGIFEDIQTGMLSALKQDESYIASRLQDFNSFIKMRDPDAPEKEENFDKDGGISLQRMNHSSPFDPEEKFADDTGVRLTSVERWLSYLPKETKISPADLRPTLFGNSAPIAGSEAKIELPDKKIAVKGFSE